MEPGRWLRGRGWRSGDWSPEIEPTRQALDAVTGDTPTALMARDYHSLWLNSAALAAADGDLQVPGGVVELDEAGEPTGVLREESAWRFRDRYLERSRRRVRRRDARRPEDRRRTRCHGGARQGRLARRAPRFWQRLRRGGRAHLRVWQSLPHDHVGRLEELGFRSGIGDELLRIGYLKVFMDGTLGSQTARLLDGSGVQITSREELADIVRAAARAGWPVGGARDRRSREPRGARRLRGDPRRLGAARASSADRARAAPGSGRRPALRRARRRGVGPVQPRAVGPGPRGSQLGREDGRRVRLPLAPGLGRAGRERLRRADRGARSARRHPRRSAPVRSTSERPGTRSRRSPSSRRSRRRSSPPRGSRETSAAAASSCPATSPTSSSSTATRWRSPRRSYPKSRSSQRCSAAGGFTTLPVGLTGLTGGTSRFPQTPHWSASRTGGFAAGSTTRPLGLVRGQTLLSLTGPDPVKKVRRECRRARSRVSLLADLGAATFTGSDPVKAYGVRPC